MIDPARHDDHLHRLQSACIDLAHTRTNEPFEPCNREELHFSAGRFAPDEMLAPWGAVLQTAEAQWYPLTWMGGADRWSRRDVPVHLADRHASCGDGGGRAPESGLSM